MFEIEALLRSSAVKKIGTLVSLTALCLACSFEPTAPADRVLSNAKVYTLNWSEPDLDGQPATDSPHTSSGWEPDAEAIAITNGRIAFVGSQKEVEAWIGPNTEVLDLHGATVIPGLVDSHTHVAELGRLQANVNLVGVLTEEEAVGKVLEHARGVPVGEWIIGQGWDEGLWADRYPTHEALSVAVPDHPVVLRSLHGFAVWGNQLALQRAGINIDTPAPDGGEILRDANGHPTGVLLNRAGPLLADAIPDTTPTQFRTFVRTGLQQMARDGYVAVHEAGAEKAHMEAFESLLSSGELPVRVYAMLSARDETLCREWLQKGPDSGLDDRLAVRSVKAYYDAALGSRGARLLADYSDRPGHRGTSGQEYGFDETLVSDMAHGGFQLAIHAIGDAGNRETLDFLSRLASEDETVLNHRHRIEHAQVIHPDDMERFAQLRTIASMEPPHAVEDMAWAEDRLGAQRIQGAYAWRSLRNAGARLTFNSDLPGSDHSFFYGFHAAVTRRNQNQQPPSGWYPKQALTPEEALRAYTNWSAYAAHWEDATGKIASGLWADLTVMDLDPLAVGEQTPSELLKGRILATLVAGELVFEELP